MMGSDLGVGSLVLEMELKWVRFTLASTEGGGA